VIFIKDDEDGGGEVASPRIMFTSTITTSKITIYSKMMGSPSARQPGVPSFYGNLLKLIHIVALSDSISANSPANAKIQFLRIVILSVPLALKTCQDMIPISDTTMVQEYMYIQLILAFLPHAR
jgi:hypothetical protein